MEKTCVVCHDRPASYRCIQCHKPVCDSCGFKDAQGAFCSRKCSADYRAFKETGAKEESGGLVRSLFRKVLILIVLIIVAGVVYAYGARRGWFGEKEEQRIEEGREKLQEGMRRGEEKLQELQEEAEETMGD